MSVQGGRRMNREELVSQMTKEQRDKRINKLAGYYGHCLLEKCTNEYFKHPEKVKYWDNEIAICKYTAEQYNMYNEVVEEIKRRSIEPLKEADETGVAEVMMISGFMFKQAIEAL